MNTKHIWIFFSVIILALFVSACGASKNSTATVGKKQKKEVIEEKVIKTNQDRPRSN